MMQQKKLFELPSLLLPSLLPSLLLSLPSSLLPSLLSSLLLPLLSRLLSVLFTAVAIDRTQGYLISADDIYEICDKSEA